MTCALNPFSNCLFHKRSTYLSVLSISHAYMCVCVCYRCGKCRRYMKYIQTKPSRMHCAHCNETYNLPQNGNIRIYKELKCPLDDFELLSWSTGTRGKSYTFCPYCYNNPPFRYVTNMRRDLYNHKTNMPERGL